MTSDILIALAVSLHANQCLSDPDSVTPELLGKIGVLKSAYEIEFARSSAGSGIPGTARWFKRLKSERVESVRLRLPERIGPNMPGGNWGIFTEGMEGSERWQVRRVSRRGTLGDPTPWKIEFQATRVQRLTDQEPAERVELSEFISAFGQMVSLVAKLHPSLVTKVEHCLFALRKGADVNSEYSDSVPQALQKELHSCLCVLLTMPVMCQLVGVLKGDVEQIEELQRLWRCSRLIFESSVNARIVPNDQKRLTA